MELMEYLYVDEKRLDTYFEQISSPVTYDKVPEWNAEISFTGPKGGGKQARFARPFTTHEKISTLTKHLEDNELVTYGRAWAGEVFRIETCRAKRVYIPPDHGQPPDVGALNVWISAVPRTAEEIRDIIERGGAFEKDAGSHAGPTGASVMGSREGNLYLLENDRYPDKQTYASMSSYSALQIMVGDVPGVQRTRADGIRYFDNVHEPRWEREWRGEKSLFDPLWVDDDAASKLNPRLKPTWYQELDKMLTQYVDERVKPEFEDSPQRDALQEELRQKVERETMFYMYFLVDPAAALAQLGAQVGPERTIRTLYRVRAIFTEYELAINYGQFDIAIFGYPIFIAEAPPG